MSEQQHTSEERPEATADPDDTNDTDGTDHTDDTDGTDESAGQVSEVSRMPADGDAEVSDAQSVAGNPDSPSSEDIGEIGPGANQFRDRPGPR